MSGKYNPVPVPKECYAGIVLLSCLFDWLHSDIARLYNVKPSTIQRVIHRWRFA